MDESTNNVVIQVELDRELLNRDLANLRQDLEKINDIKVTADIKHVTAKINEIKKTLQDTAIPLNLQPNIIGFLAAINQIPPQSVSVDLKINQDSFVADALQLQKKRLELGVAIKEKEGETFSALVTQIRSRILGAANQFNTAKIPVAITESLTENLTVLKESVDKRLASLKSVLEVALDLKPGELKRIQSLVKNAVVPSAKSKSKRSSDITAQTDTITSQTDVPDIRASLDFDTTEDDVRNIRQQVENLKTLINTPAGKDFVGSLFDNQGLKELQNFGKLFRNEFNIEGIDLRAKDKLRQAILDALPEVERQLNEVERRFEQTFADINSDPSNQIQLELDDTQARIDLAAFLERIPESETIRILLNLADIESDVSRIRTLIPEQQSINISGTISPETEASVNELIAKLNQTQNLLVNLVADEAKQELNELTSDRNIAVRLDLPNNDEINLLFDTGIKEISQESLVAEKERARAYINNLEALFFKTDLYFVKTEEINAVAKNLQTKIDDVKEALFKTSLKEVTKTAIESERSRIQNVMNELKKVSFNTAIKELTKAAIEAEKSRAQKIINEAGSLDFTSNISANRTDEPTTIRVDNTQAIAAINETLALIPPELRTNFAITLIQEPKTGLAAKLEAIKNAVASIPANPDPVTFSFALKSPDDLENRLNSIKSTIESFPKGFSESLTFKLNAPENLEERLAAIDAAIKNASKSSSESFTFILNAAEDLEQRLASIKAATTDLPKTTSRTFTFALKADNNLETRLESIKAQLATLPPSPNPINISFVLTADQNLETRLNLIKSVVESLPENKERTFKFTLTATENLESRVEEIKTAVANLPENVDAKINVSLTDVKKEEVTSKHKLVQADLDSLGAVLFSTSIKEVTKTEIENERKRIQALIKDSIAKIKFLTSLEDVTIESLNNTVASAQAKADSAAINFKASITPVTTQRVNEIAAEAQSTASQTNLIDFVANLNGVADEAINNERNRLQTYINALDSVNFKTSVGNVSDETLKLERNRIQTQLFSLKEVSFKTALKQVLKKDIEAEKNKIQQSINSDNDNVKFTLDISNVSEEKVTNEKNRVQAYTDTLNSILFKTDLYLVREEDISTVLNNAQTKANELKKNLSFKTSIKEVTKTAIEAEQTRIQQLIKAEIDPVEFTSGITNISNETINAEKTRVQKYITSLDSVFFKTDLYFVKSEDAAAVLKNAQAKLNNLDYLFYKTAIKEVTITSINAEKGRIQQVLTSEVGAVEFKTDIKAVTKTALEAEQSRIQGVVNSFNPIKFQASAEISQGSVTESLKLLNSINDNADRVRSFIAQNPIDVTLSLLEIADNVIARYISKLQIRFNKNEVSISPKITTTDGAVTGFVKNIERQIFAAKPVAIVGVEPSSTGLKNAITDLRRQAAKADVRVTLDLDDTNITKSFDKLSAFTASLAKTTKFIETGGFDVLMGKFDVITSRYVDLATLMANVVLSPSTDITELVKLLTVLDSIKAQVKSLYKSSITITPGKLEASGSSKNSSQQGPIEPGFSLQDLNEVTNDRLTTIRRAYTYEIQEVERLRKAQQISQSQADERAKESGIRFNQSLKSIYEDRTAIISDALSNNQIDGGVAAKQIADSEAAIKSATTNQAKLEKGETDEQIAKRIAAQEKAELDSIKRITRSQEQSLKDRINNELETLNTQLKNKSISEEDAKQFKKQLELDLNQELARIYNDRTAALQDSISRGLLSDKAASQAMLESRKQVAAANEKIAKQQLSEIKPATAVSESLVTSKNDFNRTVDAEKQQVIRSIAELDITDYKTGVATVERLEAALNQKIDTLYRERLNKLRKFSTDRVSDQQYVAKEIIDLENKIADNTSRNLRKLETDAKSVRGVINFSRITDELKEAALQIAVYGTLFAAGGLPFQIAKTAIELEKYSRLIQSVTKDNADASKSFALVRNLVQDYGLQLEPLIAGYGKLRAAAKDTGLTIEETNKLFRGIALASGGLQLSADETTGTIKAFTDALSKGTFQSEELKGQLGDRLVGAFNLVAKSLGKTTAQLSDELKQGQIKSVDVARALSITLEQEYGGAAAAAAKTTAGLLNTLNSQFATFSERTGKDLLPLVNNALEGTNTLLKISAENADLIIPVLTGVAAGFALVASKKLLLDLLPVTLNAIYAGMTNIANINEAANGSTKRFSATTIELTESQKALSTSLKSNLAAIGTNIGLFAAIGLAVSAATLAYSNATASAKDYEDALKSILELEEKIAARKANKPTDGSAFGAEKALADQRRKTTEDRFSAFFDPRTDFSSQGTRDKINRSIRNNEEVGLQDRLLVNPFSEEAKIISQYNSSVRDSKKLFDESSKAIKNNTTALDELRASRIAYTNIKGKENAGQVVTPSEAKFLREYEEKLNDTTERITNYKNQLKGLSPQNQAQANSIKQLVSQLELQADQLRNTTLAVKQYISTTSEAEKITGLLQRRVDLGRLFSRDPQRNKDNKAARENLDDEIELAKIAKQIKDKQNELSAEADLDKRRAIEQEILELKVKNNDKLDAIAERSFNREKEKAETAAKEKLEKQKKLIEQRLDKELAAIDTVYRADIKLINERSRAYDKVKIDLDIIGKNLERQNTLLSSQKDLAKSIADLRTARAEQALNLTNETNDIGKQLKESNEKIKELQSKIQEAYFGKEGPKFEEALRLEEQLTREVKRRNELNAQSKELRQSTGRPDRLAPGVTEEQDAIISRQIQESKLADLKFKSLREQLGFERQLLDLDFKKQENALKLLQIEQEIAKTKLRGEQRTARRDLENAQSELKNLKPDATLKEQREARNKVEDALARLEDVNSQIGSTSKIDGLIREQFGDLAQTRSIKEQTLNNRGTLESEQFKFERDSVNRKNRNELAGAGVDPKLAPAQPVIQPLTAQEFATQMTPIATQQTTQIVTTINAAATLIESAIRSSAPVINVQGAQQQRQVTPAAGRNL